MTFVVGQVVVVVCAHVVVATQKQRTEATRKIFGFGVAGFRLETNSSIPVLTIGLLEWPVLEICQDIRVS